MTVEQTEIEVMVEVTRDPFSRNISIHVHTDRPMTARFFVEELAAIVAEYQDNPEELLAASELIEGQ